MAEARAIRRKNDEGRRDDLIAAATKVIVRDGVAAATTRRIAAEAGVPLGTVHYWFASKDDLLTAVVEAVLGDLESAVAATQTQAARSDDPGAPEDLLGACRAAWRVVETDEPGRQLSLYEMTTVALRTPGMEELAAKQYDSYRASAAHAVRPWYDRFGAELPGGLEALARLVAYLFDGAALAWLADPDRAEQDSVFVLLCHLLELSATGSRLGEQAAGNTA
jgi:AcrR family transcriptional regulator